MDVELRPVDRQNKAECIALRVSKDQEPYICSNEQSWNDAVENAGVARPFAIRCEGKVVGFTMFAFDENYPDVNDRYWLWRFMIDENFQGKGYGKLALECIIRYFRANGADHIRLSTKERNIKAISLYKRFGFSETGEMNGDEVVYELRLDR